MGCTCNPLTYERQRELLCLDNLVSPPFWSKSIHFRLHSPIMMITVILKIIIVIFEQLGFLRPVTNIETGEAIPTTGYGDQ